MGSVVDVTHIYRIPSFSKLASAFPDLTLGLPAILSCSTSDVRRLSLETFQHLDALVICTAGCDIDLQADPRLCSLSVANDSLRDPFKRN